MDQNSQPPEKNNLLNDIVSSIQRGRLLTQLSRTLVGLTTSAASSGPLIIIVIIVVVFFTFIIVISSGDLSPSIPGGGTPSKAPGGSPSIPPPMGSATPTISFNDQ